MKNKKCEILKKKMSKKMTPSSVKLNNIAKILRETFKHHKFRNELQKKAVLSVCKCKFIGLSSVCLFAVVTATTFALGLAQREIAYKITLECLIHHTCAVAIELTKFVLLCSNPTVRISSDNRYQYYWHNTVFFFFSVMS